jgi:AcrR family transcriptional regulator
METKSKNEEARHRILEAAFAVFMEHGYAAASTLAIATRARVSKRELYAHFGSKQEMLVSCISERARRMKVAADLPAPTDRTALARTLEAAGTGLLREITDPTVVSVFRLAIAEAARAPEIGRTLDSIGRQASLAALRATLERASSSRLIEGDPAQMAELLSDLIIGNLMVGLLLGVAQHPDNRAITRRAKEATKVFMLLHPKPREAG